jgi:ribose-phosphate pyrophosphokinase
MNANFPECIDVLTFPDGQTHIRVVAENADFSDSDFGVANITARIKNNNDLINFCYYVDWLHDHCYKVNVTLLYLIGQRDDRAISPDDHISLRTICTIISNLRLNTIEVFCPHSQSTLDLLRTDKGFAYSLLGLEQTFFANAAQNFNPDAIALPDAGAGKRFYNDHPALLRKYRVLECGKHRNMETGKLSGFNVPYESVPENVLIVDDLCDAGGTFCGLAKELRNKGAKRIGLAVCHGIMSKGLPLDSIDKVYTTNSYNNSFRFSTFSLEYLNVMEL